MNLSSSLCAAVAIGLAAVPLSAAAPKKKKHAAAVPPALTVKRGLPYIKDDLPAHQLDLYVPVKKTPPPLFVFVHGGAWRVGDKGDYAALANAFARVGVAVANVNYRLSSDGRTRHPGPVEDVAAAFHWLRGHAGEFGYAPDKIFMGGHSAGAHAVALLALDKKYLARVGEKPDAIAGVIGLEGIYSVPALVQRWPAYRSDFIESAFGPDEAGWWDASPAAHVGLTKARWLLAHSSADELVDVGQTQAFADRLAAAGDNVTLETNFSKSHFAAVADLSNPNDPLAAAILKFVKK